MSTEAMKLALEAIQDLRGYRPDIDKAIDAIRTAIQQAETQHPIKTQQPTTAIACGITGMAKTTCPYCEQSFAFEHEQSNKGEPVGEVFYATYGGDDETGARYYMGPCVHWVDRAPPAGTKLYDHQRPEKVPMTDEQHFASWLGVSCRYILGP